MDCYGYRKVKEKGAAALVSVHTMLPHGVSTKNVTKAAAAHSTQERVPTWVRGRGVVQKVGTPMLQVLKRLGVRHVVHQHAHVRPAVEGLAQGLELLLPGRVPDLTKGEQEKGEGRGKGRGWVAQNTHNTQHGPATSPACRQSSRPWSRSPPRWWPCTSCQSASARTGSSGRFYPPCCQMGGHGVRRRLRWRRRSIGGSVGGWMECVEAANHKETTIKKDVPAVAQDDVLEQDLLAVRHGCARGLWGWWGRWGMRRLRQGGGRRRDLSRHQHDRRAGGPLHAAAAWGWCCGGAWGWGHGGGVVGGVMRVMNECPR